MWRVSYYEDNAGTSLKVVQLSETNGFGIGNKRFAFRFEDKQNDFLQFYNIGNMGNVSII